MEKKMPFCKGARIIFSVCLPLILLSLTTLLIAYLMERECAPIRAAIYYRGALEYILAGITITIGGSLLAEIAAAET